MSIQEDVKKVWDEAKDAEGEVVKVDWFDIAEHDNCQQRASMMPNCMCVSYGKLMHCDGKQLVLLKETRGDTEDTRQVFPIGCVWRITRLYDRWEHPDNNKKAKP